jgi:bifunctional non-homologous end joining protein LigD
VEYLTFKGEIPEGEYGAGLVKIWDKGKFKKMRVVRKGKKVIELEFDLIGKKLAGTYVMLKTDFAGNKDSWLIFKK